MHGRADTDDSGLRSELSRVIDEAAFPANRLALVAQALWAKASDPVLERVGRLPDVAFTRPDAVWAALGLPA